MKHHIAVKFIAVLLAALALLAAVGSGAGIIGLTATDLYENSVEELYNESMQNTRQNFAVNLAHRYASLQLGRLPEQYLNDYYGLNWMYNTFQYGYFYYTIYNEHGEVVESTMDEAPVGGTRYEMAVTNIRYRCFVEIIDHESSQPAESLPPSTEADTASPTEMPEATIPEDTMMQGTTPPETQPDSTAPAIASDATQPASEPPSDETSLNATQPPATEATEASPDVVYSVMESAEQHELVWDSYFDYEQEKFVYFSFTYQDLPPYTVELYLLPGAMPEEYAWTIIRGVWTIRYELFYILGFSLLIFAVLAVYLCCAAGKKPGQAEIKAGGLNRVPLDLYAGAGGGAIVLIVVLFAAYGGVLLRHSPKILIPVIILAGYLCCLILVGFFFAFAAQFKTPGGFWYRNTLVSHFFRALWLLCGMFITLLKQFIPWFAEVLKKLFRFLGQATKWLWFFSIKLLRNTYILTEKALGKAFELLGKASRWLGRRLHTFLRMLPLTWQWLLVGFGMFLLVAMVFAANGEEVLTVICMGICIGIIFYGAHAFGILMEATRRMGKGDLETKVSDQFLIGSFKEFAADLNALADVAVVAAQKQLKSERMKTELITNVSHDIKTPLTSIINYVDLLQKPHTDEEQEVYLEVLSRQSLQLKKLIDDLMEMSKASTGNMSVDITSVNAAEAINQALGEFSDKLEKAQLIPVFRQPDEPVYMKADGRLAWRVMSNLLSNAVKYALPGTRLYIDLQELDGKVVISMKNISREELNVSADELLERFVRGDASRNTEGSGLGLNIAQSLMELQKGKLQLLVDGDLFKVTLIFPAVQL